MYVAKFGFRWDEHYLALGGFIIGDGLLPYRDYRIPIGPIPIVLQSFGRLFNRDLFFCYTFPASCFSGLMVYLFGLKFYKNCRSLIGLFFFSIIVHFSFFGGAGALWYNQLAAIFGSLAILLLQCETSNTDSHNNFGVALLLALSFLCKQDGALLIAICFVIGFMLLKNFRRALLFPMLFMALTGILLLIWQVTFGGEPFVTINLLVNGYPSRLKFLLSFQDFKEKLNQVLFFSRNFYLIFAFSFGILSWNSISGSLSGKIKSVSVFAICSAFIAGLFIMFTSGYGSGYIGPGYVPVMLMLANFRGRVVRLFGLLLLFIIAGGYSYIFFKDFSAVKFGNLSDNKVPPYLRGFVYTDETAALFQEFNGLIEQKANAGDSIFLGGMYQFLHPKLKVWLGDGPLWIHDGVTSKEGDLCKLVYEFNLDTPRFIIDLWGESEVMLNYRWGTCKSEYQKLLESYSPILEGKIEVIGTGGTETLVRVYEIKK